MENQNNMLLPVKHFYYYRGFSQQNVNLSAKEAKCEGHVFPLPGRLLRVLPAGAVKHLEPLPVEMSNDPRLMSFFDCAGRKQHAPPPPPRKS